MKKILFLAVMAILLNSCSSSEKNYVDLNATVGFSGTQFVIKNNDIFDYTNAVMEINDKFMLKDCTIKSGETYTVGMMQFADSDGNRFDFMKKPQQFTIYCDIPEGKRGSLYASW